MKTWWVIPINQHLPSDATAPAVANVEPLDSVGSLPSGLPLQASSSFPNQPMSSRSALGNQLPLPGMDRSAAVLGDQDVEVGLHHHGGSSSAQPLVGPHSALSAILGAKARDFHTRVNIAPANHECSHSKGTKGGGFGRCCGAKIPAFRARGCGEIRPLAKATNDRYPGRYPFPAYSRGADARPFSGGAGDAQGLAAELQDLTGSRY